MRATRRSSLLIAGIIGGGLAAVIAGFIFAVAISGTRGTGQVPATPTSTPTASEAPPSTTGSPAASPSPSPIEDPILPNRQIAIVAVDALNLRAHASESAASMTVLEAGTQLFVIGEPEETGDLRWYRVAVGFADELCVNDDCQRDIGWVATPANGVESYITNADVDCPSSPLTVDQLVDLAPLHRLHCYGNEVLTGTGWADNHCCAYVGPIAYTPQWLAYPPWHFFRASDFYDTITYQQPLEGGEEWVADWPEPGDIVRFTGHFEDPAAPTCRSAIAEDWQDTSAVELEDPAVMVLTCRLQFVVTEYEVIGHEGEGSCGCLEPPSSPSAPTGLDIGDGLRRTA